MLSRASWDEDAVAGDVRDYVTTAFADPDAVLVVDETGDVKKGVATSVCNVSTPVPRDGSRTRSRVYLTYAAVRGHALIDGALYLPKSGQKIRSDGCVPAFPTISSSPLNLYWRNA